jgi:hypothetical protein
MRKSTLLSVLVFALACSLATVVYASNPPINLTDGYEITTNWHGVDIPLGTEVVATAMTIDPEVTQVTFLWKNPAKQIVFQETVPVFQNETTGSGQVHGTKYENAKVSFATSEYTPQAVGDWGVQALFQDSSGDAYQSMSWVLAIRAISFNVIPEIPLLGTAGASIAMIAGFTYKMKRKPQN